MAKRYDPEVKAAILKAATEARAAEKPWAVALGAAKAVGFHGTADGLYQMVKNAESRVGKRGRTRRAKPQAAPAMPSAGKGAGGVSEIEAMIEDLVNKRVNAALDQAIAALNKARL